MRIIFCLFLVLLMSSCGVTVNYDYKKATDFSKYKSYNYYSDLETGLSELDTKRLIRVMDSSLVKRGYVKSDYPDFMINIVSSEFQNPSQSNVGVGVGGTGGNVGGGISVGFPIGQSKTSREVIFEFVDAKTNSLFWQAVSQSNYSPNNSPEQREAKLKTIVEKVLEGYPPK